MQKIDITSTVLEKGFDIAKGFVEKLIYPTAEEMGLLLKDGISKWRFMNQVKTLVKAQAICEKNGINTKNISPKLLCPLLEYAGLEDNHLLQDKWATLLANMVDSDQNIENHVFPYLLSQLSIQEFEILEGAVTIKIERIRNLNAELNEHLKSKDKMLNELSIEIVKIEKEISDRKTHNINDPKNYQEYSDLYNRTVELKNEMFLLETKQGRLERGISNPELISNHNLRGYEISNLVRLGVVKEIVRSYGYVEDQEVVVSQTSYLAGAASYVNLNDLAVTIETDTIEFELTELGEFFIKACQEKKTTE